MNIHKKAARPLDLASTTKKSYKKDVETLMARWLIVDRAIKRRERK